MQQLRCHICFMLHACATRANQHLLPANSGLHTSTPHSLAQSFCTRVFSHSHSGDTRRRAERRAGRMAAPSAGGPAAAAQARRRSGGVGS
eukprot:354574-Chlamydomonas_euryale.AAC.8